MGLRLHRFTFKLLFALCIAAFASSSASGLKVSVRTAGGESSFHADLSDTVTVDVVVDSEGESITGVELFLSYNPTLFFPIDTDLTLAGNQPVLSAGGFGQVFADSVIQSNGSTSIIHFAEVNLIGETVSGSLGTMQFVVVGLVSGTSAIGVYEDTTAVFSSLYTTADREGDSVPIPPTAKVVFEDLPPTLSTLSTFTIEEDGGPAVLLIDIGTDRESAHNQLTFAVTMDDSTVGASVDGDSLRFETPKDLFGAFTGMIMLTDPAGGNASAAITLNVLPKNDPPVIDRTTLPDTLLVGNEAILVDLVGGDIDDDLVVLRWFVTSLSDSLTAEVEGSRLTLTATPDWNGSALVTIQLVDEGGLVDFLSIRALGMAIKADFDRSGSVDFADFLMFAEAFGGTSTQFDLDRSGLVDFLDFLIFAENFG